MQRQKSPRRHKFSTNNNKSIKQHSLKLNPNIVINKGITQDANKITHCLRIFFKEKQTRLKTVLTRVFLKKKNPKNKK